MLCKHCKLLSITKDPVLIKYLNNIKCNLNTQNIELKTNSFVSTEVTDLLKSNFVIVIIDDNIEALKIITKPIIFLSSNSMLLSKAYSLGANDFLVKPLNYNLFSYKLNLFLNSQCNEVSIKEQVKLKQKIRDEFNMALSNSKVLNELVKLKDINYEEN